MGVTQRLIEVFSCFSRLLNVLRGGTADLTLSAAAHIEGLLIERYIDAFFWHIFQETNHCRKWWIREVNRSRRNIERWKDTL